MPPDSGFDQAYLSELQDAASPLCTHQETEGTLIKIWTKLCLSPKLRIFSQNYNLYSNFLINSKFD